MSEKDDEKAELLRILEDDLDPEHARVVADLKERNARRRRAGSKEGEPRRAEVRAWLAGNKGKDPIACNHFRSRADAEAFVESIYSAGAITVEADPIQYHDAEQWGGPYTDQLRVQLPEAADARAAIIALCNQHCMADPTMGTKFEDKGQSELLLWWD